MPEITQTEHDQWQRLRNLLGDEPGGTWLRCLIADYEQLRELEEDEDPTATLEMLMECRRSRHSILIAATAGNARRKPSPTNDLR